MASNIHSMAVVDSSAELEPGVRIGPYSVIGPDVKIGKGTVIGPHVVIQGPTTIGEDNHIFQFSSIGEVPQDKKYEGEDSELIIGNRNTIREFCTINRGTSLGGGSTRIRDDNWIMAYVHIAHDCIIGSHTIFSNGASVAGHVVVEDYVALGGFTLVHQFCRIGAHSFCGMGSAINKDLPPYVIAAGNLAKLYGLNKEGLRRRDFSEELIQALHKVYKAIIATKGVRDAEREKVLPLVDKYPEVKYLIDFIDNSSRGILR